MIKTALLNKTVFKVKIKFEGKNCVLQISARQFFGVKYLTEFNSSPFFLHFRLKLKRKIEICLFRPQKIYLEYLGAVKMRDKDEISI